MKNFQTSFRSRYLLLAGIIFLSLSAKSQIDFSAHHNILVEYDPGHDFALLYENSILDREHLLLLGYAGISSNLSIDNKRSRGINTNNFGTRVGFNLLIGNNKHHFESGFAFIWKKFSNKFDDFKN